MKKILIDDFEIEKNDWGYYFTANIDFLGQNSELLLNYDTEEEISEVELKDILNKSLEKINNMLEKAEKNRSQLMKLLKEKDYINLATEWVEGAEEVEEEENCYLIDDNKVYTPITEEDFEKSMNFGEIATDIYSDGETEDMSVYITFEPDYFAGHCIECYIDKNGNFLVNGLAG
ncbi:DUF2262 domain-containing protein [uncultured Fusobacterium sp.]|jgi:hypothetical protein|uniref:DUF2262 domain-containing protein n=1 Tax=uncultured Fusobacterium sp. TaxID=159267 RepID=UPI0025D1D1B1|nr:DUF2262 domain-containing protein [uncultured Fusobacterium sp.]MCF2638405.1 DUF2262 domain-containing protein [Fusobacterium varium]